MEKEPSQIEGVGMTYSDIYLLQRMGIFGEVIPNNIL